MYLAVMVLKSQKALADANVDTICMGVILTPLTVVVNGVKFVPSLDCETLICIAPVRGTGVNVNECVAAVLEEVKLMNNPVRALDDDVARYRLLASFAMA